MLVMEEKPNLTHASEYSSELHVERTDILFQDVAGDRLQIKVTVRNPGELPSRRTVMKIESAPFGAFVAWRPLTQLIVPALDPGESRELSTEVPRPRPVPLGDFSGLPPRRLLTALSSQDQPSEPNNGTQTLLEVIWRARSAPGTKSARDASLAPDLWDLVGRGQPHWAGNLNVFVGSRAVERHLARALRIYPGRSNLAMFAVGTPGKPDEFAFELVGLDADWNAALYDTTHGKSLRVEPSSTYIEEAQWVKSNGGLMVMLATQPPKDCSVGNLEVHVTRRTDQQKAIVEFDLNPAAQGSGCYCV